MKEEKGGCVHHQTVRDKTALQPTDRTHVSSSHWSLFPAGTIPQQQDTSWLLREKITAAHCLVWELSVRQSWTNPKQHSQTNCLVDKVQSKVTGALGGLCVSAALKEPQEDFGVFSVGYWNWQHNAFILTGCSNMLDITLLSYSYFLWHYYPRIHVTGAGKHVSSDKFIHLEQCYTDQGFYAFSKVKFKHFSSIFKVFQHVTAIANYVFI